MQPQTSDPGEIDFRTNSRKPATVHRRTDVDACNEVSTLAFALLALACGSDGHKTANSGTSCGHGRVEIGGECVLAPRCDGGTSGEGGQCATNGGVSGASGQTTDAGTAGSVMGPNCKDIIASTEHPQADDWGNIFLLVRDSITRDERGISLTGFTATTDYRARVVDELYSIDGELLASRVITLFPDTVNAANAELAAATGAASGERAIVSGDNRVLVLPALTPGDFPPLLEQPPTLNLYPDPSDFVYPASDIGWDGTHFAVTAFGGGGPFDSQIPGGFALLNFRVDLNQQLVSGPTLFGSTGNYGSGPLGYTSNTQAGTTIVASYSGNSVFFSGIEKEGTPLAPPEEVPVSLEANYTATRPASAPDDKGIWLGSGLQQVAGTTLPGLIAWRTDRNGHIVFGPHTWVFPEDDLWGEVRAMAIASHGSLSATYVVASGYRIYVFRVGAKGIENPHILIQQDFEPPFGSEDLYDLRDFQLSQWQGEIWLGFSQVDTEPSFARVLRIDDPSCSYPAHPTPALPMAQKGISP